MDPNIELSKINEDLAKSAVRLRIEKRGDLLNLRGPLPSRSNAMETKVQRISLRLKADHEGLMQAQKILEMVLFQLNQNQFNWNHWGNNQHSKSLQKTESPDHEKLENFKSAFFSDPLRKRSKSGTITTWNSAYLPYLNRLMRIGMKETCKLNVNLFNKTLTSYSENSRSRQQCATALSAFANYLELQLPDNWRANGNGYGLHKAHFRKLPSDNQIKETWLQIPNPKWRLAYGLMATYGLRNHEVFFCDFSGLTNDGDKVIRVLPNTKTGEHQVWPFHPSWFTLFNLEQLAKNPKALPSIKTDLNSTTLQKVGRRVTEQFHRYNLQLTPYDLRHAWAIRTIHIGLPDSVAARMMGHSVSIHNKTYHHWITRRDQQKAVDDALARKIA